MEAAPLVTLWDGVERDGPSVVTFLLDALWFTPQASQLLPLCFKLNTCLERLQRSPTGNQLESWRSDTATVAAYDAVQQLCQSLVPGQPFDKVLERLELARCFPLVLNTIVAPGVVHKDVTPTPRDYYNLMTQLNNLLSMAQQLRSDVNLSNHKYMAHQVALLYQCLNSLKSRWADPLKKRVEGEFERIKRATERQEDGDPQLNEKQRMWLVRLCDDIEAECGLMSDQMLLKVRAFSDFVKAP